MRIAVVIVNYRTPELVTRCLDSLAGERGNGVEIAAFVGDADSGDGSVESIGAHIRVAGYDWAECFAIGRNGGFAYGNNHILRSRVLPDPSFDLVHFLNPDTYIHPGAVRALAAFLAAHPGAGVAGSRLENPDGSLRAFGFRRPTPWREFFRGARAAPLNRLVPSADVFIADLRETRRVDWVSGASFMMPRAVLEAVGLMDEGYFLYFEDTELMVRTDAAGYPVWHVADSRVVHLAGQSTGLRSGGPARPGPVPRIWLRSRRRFFRDRYGIVGAALADALFLAGDVVYRLHRVLLRRPVLDPPDLWRAYLSSSPPAPPGEG